MIESWILEGKAQVIRGAFGDWDSSLPTYRQLMIQLDKLERMAKDFRKRFPSLPLIGPGSKPGKTEGEHRHRLHQQNKLVDSLIRKLLEERFTAEHQHITANKVRSFMKGYVEKATGRIYKQFQEALMAAIQEQIKGLDKAGLGGLALPSSTSRSRVKRSSRRTKKLKA